MIPFNIIFFFVLIDNGIFFLLTHDFDRRARIHMRYIFLHSLVLSCCLYEMMCLVSSVWFRFAWLVVVPECGMYTLYLCSSACVNNCLRHTATRARPPVLLPKGRCGHYSRQKKQCRKAQEIVFRAKLMLGTRERDSAKSSNGIAVAAEVNVGHIWDAMPLHDGARSHQ